MSDELAYFLTWTTYGTWLHGDERGSVDADHNRLHTPFVPPNPERLRHARVDLKHPPMLLTTAQRQVVGETIQAHREFRGWRVVALNVRTNHVHVVIQRFGAAPPEKVLQEL